MEEKAPKIFVSHWRRDVNDGTLKRYFRCAGKVGNGFEPHTHGGMTTVELNFEDGLTISACSTCADCDQFSYKRGYQIALGRAIKALENL